jgi:murein DD-endopeptidase MepM/ murein hydrolase activator NlpD
MRRSDDTAVVEAESRAGVLFARARVARRAAGVSGRGAAASALTVIAGVAASVMGGILLSLLIVGALLARRIIWVERGRVLQQRAVAAELGESFQQSNWRERTQWLPRAAAAVAVALALNLASPAVAAAESGPSTTTELERRSYAAFADMQRALLQLWTARDRAIMEAVEAHRAQASIDAGKTDTTEPSELETQVAAGPEVNTTEPALDAIVAATERATTLRQSALELADAADPSAGALSLEADAAERDASALAESFSIAALLAFTLALPAEGEVSSPFGARGAEFHEGIDIAANLGSPVVAAAAGTVTVAGRPYIASGDDAVVVIIDHGNGFETLYGHLAPGLEVRPGERVEAGTVLGRIGLTGRITGPHLHFMTYFEGKPVDPARFLY